MCRGIRLAVHFAGGGAVERLTESKEVVRIEDGAKSACRDRVAVEAPLAIILNGQKLVTLLCTPEKQKSLALGFLRSGGLLTSLDELLRLELSGDGTFIEVELTGAVPVEKVHRKSTITPGGGRGVLFFNVEEGLRGSPVPGEGLSLQVEEISSLMDSLQERSRIFKATGGTHSAALADAGGLIIYCEDIGRHNAVDKIIGECLLRGIPVEDKALVCSGRLSSEILLKAARLRLPLLLSRAAPTTLSIELAEALNITLIGFVRGRRMNIYTHPHRVKGSPADS